MKHTIRLSKCCRANIILTIPTGFEKCGTCGKLCQIENIPVTPDEDIAEVFKMALAERPDSVLDKIQTAFVNIAIRGIAQKLNIKL